MGTTSLHALRYPASTDDVDVPGDIKNLASDVDVALPVVAATAPAAPVTGLIWSPSDGSKPQVWNGTAWVDLAPVGALLASGSGPAAQFDFHDPAAQVASETVAVINGAKYRIDGRVIGSQQTAAGAPTMYLGVSGGTAALVAVDTAAVGDSVTLTGFLIYPATSTTSITFVMSLGDGAGVYRVPPNDATIAVTRVG